MITAEQEAAIRDVLATMPHLAVGVGTKEEACSIAALNLALTGTLTDTVPDCMSRVIGRWIIGVQDNMPAAIRDSAEWRDLLVLSAGTGRDHEQERRAVVLSWMWDALALLQPRADERGFGEAWATMLKERTPEAARAAYRAAYAGADAYADVDAAAYAGAYVYAYAYADADAGAGAAAAAGADADAWAIIDPVECLRSLVAITDERALAVQP